MDNKIVHLHFTKNTWCTITSEISSSLNTVIYDAFSKFKAQAVFSPLYKNHLLKIRGKSLPPGTRTWDGYVRFYNKEKKILKMGLLRDLLEILRKNNFSFEFSYDDETKPYFEKKLQLLDLPNEKYELREWQSIAYEAVIQRKRGLVCSPTATGKTVVISSIVNSLLKESAKVLILTQRIDLSIQTKREMVDCGIPESQVSVICSDTDDVENKVTVLCVLSEDQIKDYRKYDAVIIDESHHAKADSYINICKKCTGAWFRIGFSATFPKEGSIDMLSIQGYIGATIYKGECEYHIDKKEISEPTIYFIDYKRNKGERFDEKGDYSVLEEKYIIHNEVRNKIIVKVIEGLINKGKKVLVLSSRIDHGKNLGVILGCEYIYGDTSRKVRNMLVKDFQDGKTKLLLASTEVLGEGIDIKGGCDCFVSTGSAAGYVRVLQQIGRSMRKNKQMKVDVIDFIDKDHTTFLDHSLSRIKTCRDNYGEKRVKILKNYVD